MGAALFFLMALVITVTGLAVLFFTFRHWYLEAKSKRENATRLNDSKLV